MEVTHMDIRWYSKKAKADYELKPEDYDYVTQGGSIRVRHKSGQYVGEVIDAKRHNKRGAHYML